MRRLEVDEEARLIELRISQQHDAFDLLATICPQRQEWHRRVDDPAELLELDPGLPTSLANRVHHRGKPRDIHKGCKPCRLGAPLQWCQPKLQHHRGLGGLQHVLLGQARRAWKPCGENGGEGALAHRPPLSPAPRAAASSNPRVAQFTAGRRTAPARAPIRAAPTAPRRDPRARFHP